MSNAAHPDAHEIEHVQQEVRRYIIVFMALLFLTIVTVGVSYLHLNIVGAIILALTVAVIKSSLVACYFMHLISERKLIYIVLSLTVVFFGSLMFLTVINHGDVIIGTHYVP